MFGLGASCGRHVFSGQLKRLMCALHIAQAQVFFAATGQRSLFLVDDVFQS